MIRESILLLLNMASKSMRRRLYAFCRFCCCHGWFLESLEKSCQKSCSEASILKRLKISGEKLSEKRPLLPSLCHRPVKGWHSLLMQLHPVGHGFASPGPAGMHTSG